MDFEKKRNTYQKVMIIVVTAIITFFVTIIGAYNYFINSKDGNTKIITKYLEKSIDDTSLSERIELIKTLLKDSYIGELDEEKMIEGAIAGYVAGIGDPYTSYFTKEEYEELMISVNGDYVGIGVYMAVSVDGEIVILLPIPNSPAEEAGLKSGDIITKVDGEDCTGVDSEIVSNKIKGEPGTTVEIEILRDGEVFTKTIERRKIELEYIDSKVLEDDIGYIELLAFNTDSSKKFKEHLDKLLDEGVKKLIIDLRNNGGGLVTEAISLSELFIPKGSNIMRIYDKQKNETIIRSSATSTYDLEIVLLTNGESASAAEIFAAALKDNNKCKIIGEKTFGKGVMQEIQELANGGALKITIEEFRTPNGDAINGVGISPDIEVKNESEEKDEQLEAAIKFLK